ncbi:hypothetical protein ACT75_00145 [Aggregatibacter actinomycetemcomitans]|uniref:Phage coat protein n=1 Tax=Aggregatibacter actinomycetemcomitans TaxID=714 RepID=A0AAC9AHH8_AGGAC|nr:hypothetical protein [Aggregatibacter actinomycetemcomitans]AMQ93043.1 hypothetical protein ACT75_00090 [Aggregatibacter actinomycetemcomitans]AMQ93052.1 hypothetical protein ACT75_00145 [Aggregatibacter actinomycetemcomitans]TYB13744.1 hypothetical protein FXB76_10240 [Aggregatibacter actinomycetemcomitans]
MLKTLKKVAGYATALTLTAFASVPSYAAGIGDIATQVDMTQPKEAVIALGVALGGFLVVGLAVRYLLGFFKRA